MPGLISNISSAVPRQTWVVASFLCLIAAAVMWVLERRDAAFVAASLGVVAWFLNLRVQLGSQNDEADAARADDEEDDDEVFEGGTEGEDDES